MNDKRLLVVSYYYAPRNVIGAVRCTKIAKYIQRLGWNVDVVTSKYDNSLIKDPLLEKDSEKTNIFEIEHSKLYSCVEKIILDKYNSFKDSNVSVNINENNLLFKLKKSIKFFTYNMAGNRF